MTRISLKALFFSSAAGIAVLSAGQAAYAEAQAPAQAPPAATESRPLLQEVVVTARRKEESIQTVPVAITAFSTQKLNQANVLTTTDLQKMTPGVVFSGAGAPSNTTFTIRGQGRFVIGSSLPSVISYFNEVPLGPWGAVLPTFDMSNIQVLKGPQGTLFGRNTTGGAVLVYSAAPNFDYGGYVQGLYGRYNWGEVQGAVNVPIIPDKLAVRVAGDLVRRDGYTKVINTSPTHANVGGAQDDLHSDAVRVSVLFAPTDYLKNTLVWDYYKSHTNGTGTSVNGFFTAPAGQRQYESVGAQYRGLDFLFGTNSGGWPNCGTSPNCDVNLAVAEQVAAGPRKTFLPQAFPDTTKIWGVSNTTEFTVGSISIKNIFGVRGDKIDNQSHTDGLAFILEDVHTVRSDRQWTDEIQVRGDLFDKRLEWLVGGFYLRNTMPGPTGLAFDAYRNPTWYPTPSSPTPNLRTLFPLGPTLPAGIPMAALLGPFNPGSAVENALFHDQSRAVFGQVIYHFAGQLEGLSLNGSVRYTSDREQACSSTVQPLSTPFIDGMKACKRTAGTAYNNAASNKMTWQVGADYKATENVFLYGVVRKGYRAGGLNTPSLGGTLAQFQSFAPQTITDEEIGAKTRWNLEGWQVGFNIAAFHSKFKDLQRSIAGLPGTADVDGDGNPLDNPSNTTFYMNGKGATTKGVEVDGFVSPISDLTVTFAGSYLDYHISHFSFPANLVATLNNALPAGSPPGAEAAILLQGETTFENAPKWSYNFGADYHLPFDSDLGQFYLHGDHYWVAKYFVGKVPMGKYSLTNFNLDWREVAGHKNLTATAFLQNAFNHTYTVSATLSGTAPGVASVSYGPPRMYGVKLRYEF